MVTKWRTSIDVIRFVKNFLPYCENKPLIKIDKAPWYRWALQRMGLKYEHEIFGERNAIEGWFNILKARSKRFWNVFLPMPQRIALKNGYRICYYLQSEGEILDTFQKIR